MTAYRGVPVEDVIRSVRAATDFVGSFALGPATHGVVKLLRSELTYEAMRGAKSREVAAAFPAHTVIDRTQRAINLPAL